MRIDVAVLVENTRRIFGLAREGNLGSRRIFLTVLADRMWPAGRYLLSPGLDNRLIDGGKFVCPTHPPHFTLQRHYYFSMFLVLISVRG
jgi:hypothetical protein